MSDGAVCACAGALSINGADVTVQRMSENTGRACRVFVGGLPETVTEAQVKAGFGKVASQITGVSIKTTYVCASACAVRALLCVGHTMTNFNPYYSDALVAPADNSVCLV